MIFLLVFVVSLATVGNIKRRVVSFDSDWSIQLISMFEIFISGMVQFLPGVSSSSGSGGGGGGGGGSKSPFNKKKKEKKRKRKEKLVILCDGSWAKIRFDWEY